MTSNANATTDFAATMARAQATCDAGNDDIRPEAMPGVKHLMKEKAFKYKYEAAVADPEIRHSWRQTIWKLRISTFGRTPMTSMRFHLQSCRCCGTWCLPVLR